MLYYDQTAPPLHCSPSRFSTRDTLTVLCVPGVCACVQKAHPETWRACAREQRSASEAQSVCVCVCGSRCTSLAWRVKEASAHSRGRRPSPTLLPSSPLLALAISCGKSGATCGAIRFPVLFPTHPFCPGRPPPPLCQTNLPIFKLKESQVRRRYSDFDWLRQELERDSKVSHTGRSRVRSGTGSQPGRAFRSLLWGKSDEGHPRPPGAAPVQPRRLPSGIHSRCPFYCPPGCHFRSWCLRFPARPSSASCPGSSRSKVSAHCPGDASLWHTKKKRRGRKLTHRARTLPALFCPPPLLLSCSHVATHPATHKASSRTSSSRTAAPAWRSLSTKSPATRWRKIKSRCTCSCRSPTSTSTTAPAPCGSSVCTPPPPPPCATRLFYRLLGAREHEQAPPLCRCSNLSVAVLVPSLFIPRLLVCSLMKQPRLGLVCLAPPFPSALGSPLFPSP